MKKLLLLISSFLFIIMSYGQSLTKYSSAYSTSIDFAPNGDAYIGTRNKGVLKFTNGSNTSTTFNNTLNIYMVKYSRSKYTMDGTDKIIVGRIDGATIFNLDGTVNTEIQAQGNHINSCELIGWGNGYVIGGTNGITDDGAMYITTGTTAYNSIIYITAPPDHSEEESLWFTNGLYLINYNLKYGTQLSSTQINISDDVPVTNLTPNKDTTKFIFAADGLIKTFDLETKVVSNIVVSGISNITYATYDKYDNIWYSYLTDNGTKFKVGTVVNGNASNIAFDFTTDVFDIKMNPVDDNIWIITANGVYVYDLDATTEAIINTDVTPKTISVTNMSNALYQWYFKNAPDAPNARTTSSDYELLPNETSNIITPSQDGYYKVIITKDNGDFSESNPVLFRTSTTTDISNSISDSDLIVFPNPNNGKFSINTKLNIIQVTVTNSLGQTEIIDYSSNEINTSFKGLVILTIKTDKGIATKKLSIK